MSSESKTIIASLLQEVYLKERQAAGYHLPGLCPNYEHNRDEAADMEEMIHCNHCDSSLLPYKDLDSYSKSRLEARAETIIDGLAAAGYKIIHQ